MRYVVGPLTFSSFHLFISPVWMLPIFIKMRGISSTVQSKRQKTLTLTISLPLLLPGSIFFGKKVVVSGLLNKRFGGWSGLIPLRLLRLPEQDCGAKNQPGTNLNPSLSAWSHQKIGNSQRRKVPWSAQHHQCCLLVWCWETYIKWPWTTESKQWVKYGHIYHFDKNVIACLSEARVPWETQFEFRSRVSRRPSGPQSVKSHF